MNTTIPTPRPASPLERLRAPLRTTPGRLWAAGAAIGLAALVFFFAVQFGVDEYRTGIKTVGADAAPSIIAAQQIRANLADMHASAALEFLAKAGPERKAAVHRYEDRRSKVTEGLLVAAKNITYKEEEEPVRTLMNALRKYERAVDRARDLREEGNPKYLALLHDADGILHDDLFPASLALDKANRDALDAGYNRQRVGSLAALMKGVLAGVALHLALVWTQVYLRRRTRRAFNPGLLAATVITLGFLIVTVVTFLSARASLREAVKDAFDSIHYLEQARADAYDARGTQRLRLLDPARADGKDGYNSRFSKQADLVNALLAQELRNITYPGEQDAADEALARFLAYLDLVRSPRTSSEGADATFDQFDQALGRTLKINEDAFKRAIDRGSDWLKPFDWAAPVAALAIALLAAGGLRPRLKEYSP